MKEDSPIHKARLILQEVVNHHNITLDLSECKIAITEIAYFINNSEDELQLELDCEEYRLISEGSIWSTYVETIKDIVTERYDLNLDNIPAFVAFSIDWEETAENAYVDGYGHTFSSYDGSELFCEDTYIFRTN